jgi:hypothetical protein
VTSTAHPLTATRQPWWLYAGVIIGALGVASLAYAALFSPQTMFAAGQSMTGAARGWARYAAAYNLALVAALLVPLALGAWRVLAGALVQAALAEVLLAVVGIADRRWEQVPADVILIAVFMLCARHLRGAPDQRGA